MTIVEQKIEKLLHDLNRYVREYDYEDEYGLPCYDTSEMAKMKAIVQAFVDSLKEDDNTKEFDENQLNAYRAFLEVGIPVEWAKAMVDRLESTKVEDREDAWEYLMSFALWDATSEGFRFWNDVSTEVAKEGVSAFSKFQCPK